MNGFAKTLAAATLLLATGCASPRREHYRHESPYPHTGTYQAPSPPDTHRNTSFENTTPNRLLPLPAPTPTPLPFEESIAAYERAIPPQIIPHSRPAENNLEQRIYDQHRVTIQGDASLPALAETKRVLENMPSLNPCPIYFIPDTLGSRKATHTGWYTANRPFDLAHIVLLKPVGADIPQPELRALLIHEFAHRRTHALGYELLARWLLLNTHDYRTDLNNEEGNHHWLTEPKNGARYGFVRPYGATNASEDIATLVEAIRTGDEITIHDDTTATVLRRKRDLLLQYQFIHPHEQLNLQGNTDSGVAIPLYIKNTLRNALISTIILCGLAYYQLRRRRQKTQAA